MGPHEASASASPGFRGGSEQRVRLSRRRQRGAGLPAWPGGPRSLRTAGWRERDRTLQEETPLAPAQTITSLILLPQNFLHWALDRRGRAACCSLSGVLRAGGTDGAGGWSGRRPAGLLCVGETRGFPETLPWPRVVLILRRHDGHGHGAPRLPSDPTRSVGQGSFPVPHRAVVTSVQARWFKQSPPCQVRAQRGSCQPPCSGWRGHVPIPGKG